MELNTLTLRHAGTLLKLAYRKLTTGSSQRTEPREVVAAPESAPVAAAPETPPEPMIDVRELIAHASIDELNEKAEAYFSHLTDWDFYLAKPFGTVGDAPQLLINFATMIQGLNLGQGQRLLDFGAGTGWTSRFLTQLGCEVIVLDVSPTALEIARELYKRQPVQGDRPAPSFLQFDGRRIDLPDASVDRILCFDSFHHAPNPEAVLREFARVLVPGGIAAFAEPGPMHSRTPQSQFEMRTYGVIENDIDIDAIWRWAQQAGFADIRLAAYNVPRYQLSLEQYHELLDGGEAYLRWAEFTRAYLRDVRNFFLRRAGEEVLDSRRSEGLSAAIEIEMPSHVSAGEQIPVRAVVKNAGTAVWLDSGVAAGGVSLGCHLYAADGQIIALDYNWQRLVPEPRPILPGEEVTVAFNLPPMSAGHYALEFDCVANRVTWFSQVGSKSVRKELEVAERP